MALEQQILTKLKSLGDTELNRIARAYARIRFGNRFKWIDGLGYNEEGKPIGLRPDVFVLESEGRLDRIEATMTKNKSNVWTKNGERGHFVNILKKIVESKIGGGLVYVAGHPDVRFIPGMQQKMIDAAVIAGLTRDLVHIIGSEALADSLAQPEMAAVRIGLLGVGDPKRFNLVRREIVPDRRRLIRSGVANPFIPTEDDLDAGTIHFPDLGHIVEHRLSKDRIALVRGLGASGKSVLAWLVGLNWQKTGNPAYYLSLRNFANDSDIAAQECIEELKLFSADNALFIIDDCHLDEEAARRIHLAWQEIKGSKPALLLVSREMRSRTGSAIHGINVEPLLLLARQNEVRGVFTRLLARHLREIGNPIPPPIPPVDVLDLWVETFGGNVSNPSTTTDLIAFSAAVQHRKNQLLKRDWTLIEGHAAEEIREHYLRPLSEGERRNLILLAAVQRFEIELPGSLLPDVSQGLRTSSDDLGIVFSRKSRIPEGTFYQLAHSALGRLILTASGDCNVEERVYPALAEKNGYFALTALRSLTAAGETSLANAVERAMLANPHLLTQLSASHCKAYLTVAEQLWHQPESDAFFALLSSPEMASGIAAKLVGGTLDSLRNFLRYLEKSAHKDIRNLHKNLAQRLTEDSLIPGFVETATLSQPDNLAGFLRYLETSNLNDLRTFRVTIVRELCMSENASAWAGAALESQTSQLGGFLYYADLRVEFDPLISRLAERCLPGSGHSEIIAQEAISLLTKAVVMGEFGDYRGALFYVRRISTVFGDSTLPLIREVVEEALEYESSYRAKIGD